MKKLLLLLVLSISVPAALTSCSTPPSARVVQVQTLKVVGEGAEATVALSAHLYAGGSITAAQANAVRAFYDLRFQPAFRTAVLAAKSDLSSLASSDIQALANQLATLLASYTTKTP